MSTFMCKDCGNVYNKWIGKCNCGSWNTVAEIKDPKLLFNNSLNNINEFNDDSPIITINNNIEEFLRVCPLITKSIIILGGEPGIGKSTLMSQICLQTTEKCLYLSGEESVENIKKRFYRLNHDVNNVEIFSFFLIEKLEEIVQKYQPVLVIIDSIHTTRSTTSEGHITQMKDVLFKTSILGKKYNFCCIMVSHITKDGIIAGPKTIEHMVDVVLYLEGDRYGNIRILRAIKNRFGNTNETGVFEMHENGLIEVKNPSALFISQRRTDVPGSVVFAGVGGSRPFMLEIQALVVESIYPQIECIGFEIKRLRMILAILQKWCNTFMYKHDIYINVVGGMKLDDPAADLAVAMAVISSFRKRLISAEVCFFGELGLTGEIRRVSDVQSRIKEAKRLGFKKIYSRFDGHNVDIKDEFICNMGLLVDLVNKL